MVQDEDGRPWRTDLRPPGGTLLLYMQRWCTAGRCPWDKQVCSMRISFERVFRYCVCITTTVAAFVIFGFVSFKYAKLHSVM